MSVSAAVETQRGRSGSKDADGNEWTRVFDVSCTSPSDDPYTASGLPAIDDLHPLDSTAVCYGFSGSQRGGTWKYWEIRANYKDAGQAAVERQARGGGEAGRAQYARNQGQDPNDPTIRAARFTGGADLMVFAFRYDRNGKAIVNTAKDALDPPLTGARPIPWIEVSQAETSSPSNKLFLLEHVNPSGFMGAAAETLKLSGLSYGDDFYRPSGGGAPVRFWMVRYRFAYDGAGWNPTRVPSMGLHQIVGGKKKKITLDNDLEATMPQPLDQDGRYTPLGEPFEIPFHLYPKANFNELHIRLG